MLVQFCIHTSVFYWQYYVNRFCIRASGPAWLMPWESAVAALHMMWLENWCDGADRFATGMYRRCKSCGVLRAQNPVSMRHASVLQFLIWGQLLVSWVVKQDSRSSRNNDPEEGTGKWQMSHRCLLGGPCSHITLFPVAFNIFVAVQKCDLEDESWNHCISQRIWGKPHSQQAASDKGACKSATSTAD